MEEEIKEFNNRIRELTDKQLNLQAEVTKMSEQKEKMKDKFIKSKTKDVNKIMELNDDVIKYISGDNSPLNLYRDLEKFYHISFHGIVHGRVETAIKFPKDMKRYDWEDNIWINSRGIAFKPNERYWGYYRKKTDATKCLYDFSNVMNIIMNNPKLVNSIKKKDKKEIFNAFYKCIKNWKSIDKDRIKIKQDIYGIGESSNYNIGLDEISIIKMNNIVVSIGSNLSIHVSQDNTWGKDRYITVDDDIDNKDKFILEQINEESLEKIEKFVNDIKKTLDYNKKLFNQLREEISPHIMHRLI
jgi:hypothetical protein